MIRDKRRIDPVTVRSGSRRRRRRPAAPAGGRDAATGALRPSVADGDGASQGGRQARRAEPSSTSAPATCSGSRRSTPTTAAGRAGPGGVREQASAACCAELLPVLDDIGRARDHDELDRRLSSAVAEALEAARLVKLGLERFGDAGTRSTRTVHEALMHSYSPDVDGPDVRARSCSPDTGSGPGSSGPPGSRSPSRPRRPTRARSARRRAAATAQPVRAARRVRTSSGPAGA